MNKLGVIYDLYNFENENRYVVISNNCYYNVDRISFKILDGLKTEQSFGGIADSINQEFGTKNYSENIIKEICLNELKEIIINVNESKTETLTNAPIYCKIILMKPTNSLNFFKIFTYLFDEKVYLKLLLFTVAINFAYFIHSYFFTIKALQIITTSTHIYTFIFLFAIFFLHEIGHATAAIRHGINPNGIGFGFYFIFPVFYTDITAIWLLNRKKRIQINMAGIYFQLLINLLLIFVYYFFLKNNLITTLITCNIMSILLSFNPFFKYDGYWIVSDFFDIPNLSKKTKECLILFKKLILNQSRTSQLLNYPPKTLIIYTILSLIFWIYFFSSLFLTLYLKIRIVFNETKIWGWTFYYYANASGLLLTFILLVYVSFKKIKNNYYE